MAIEMASKRVHFASLFFYCRHGGRRGDTEQVVACWQRSVASNVAMDMLHRAMPHVPLHRLCTAIKMACEGGTFARRRRYFVRHYS
jgi:hypothetical protein